jgi:hypothetical protein
MRKVPRNFCLECSKQCRLLYTNFCSRKCSRDYQVKNLYKNYDHFIREKIKQNITLNERGCWVWNKGKSNSGYSKMTFKNRTMCGSRVSFMVFKGKISKNKVVCHTCDNPPCVNPDHLFLGTIRDNRTDCVVKNRHAKGSKIGISKLKEKDIPIIKKMYYNNLSQREIALLFNTSQTTISRVLLKQTWSHT